MDVQPNHQPPLPTRYLLHQSPLTTSAPTDTLSPPTTSPLPQEAAAYQENIGVDDAIIYMLHRAYTHLEKPRSTLRVMFFHFSSAFNTIQPPWLAEKLSVMQVDHGLVACITDYLTSRPQYMRLQGSLSDVLVSSTDAHQGTVLSPFLFTLYTSDFRFNSSTCHLHTRTTTRWSTELWWRVL